jgi:hypothetical protein
MAPIVSLKQSAMSPFMPFMGPESKIRRILCSWRAARAGLSRQIPMKPRTLGDAIHLGEQSSLPRLDRQKKGDIALLRGNKVLWSPLFPLNKALCPPLCPPAATWRPTGWDCAVATCRRLVLRMTLDIMRPCADARDSGMVSPGATVTAASHRARRPAPSRPRAVSCPGPAARRSSRRGSRGRPPHGGQRRGSRPRRRIPPPSVC